jgi:hypothetical protein
MSGNSMWQKNYFRANRKIILVEYVLSDELNECDNIVLLKDGLFASRIAGLGIFTFRKG